MTIWVFGTLGSWRGMVDLVFLGFMDWSVLLCSFDVCLVSVRSVCLVLFLGLADCG